MSRIKQMSYYQSVSQKKKGQKEEKKKSIEVIFHHTIAILLCPIMRKVAVQTKKAIYIYKQHNFIKNNKIKRNPSSWVYTKEQQRKTKKDQRKKEVNA